MGIDFMKIKCDQVTVSDAYGCPTPCLWQSNRKTVSKYRTSTIIFNGYFRMPLVGNHCSLCKIVITPNPIRKLLSKSTGKSVSNVSSSLRTNSHFRTFADLAMARGDPSSPSVYLLLLESNGLCCSCSSRRAFRTLLLSSILSFIGLTS